MIRGSRRIKNKTLTPVCMILSLSLLLTMMPLQVNAADYSAAEYKEMMDQAQARVDQYTQQLAADKNAMQAALQAKQDAENSYNNAAAAVENAEYQLNLKSQEYVDKKIKEAWPVDVEIIKKKDSYIYDIYCSKYPDYYNTGYKIYQSEARVQTIRASSNTLIKDRLSKYEKYGSDAFEKALVNTMGYFNELEALDNIDRCNAIRANPSELAEYYVGVRGESVPDNVKQLVISPYMMVTTAINVTLCGTGVAHIYGNCGNYGAGSPLPGGGGTQNVTGGKMGDNTRIDNPFEAWWNIENHNGTVSHNDNIADPRFNQTGFAMSNPNPYTGYAVACQDFKSTAISSTSNVYIESATYTTSEYRNGLKSYCASKLAEYNSKVDACSSAKAVYETARNAYDSAYQTYLETEKLLSSARSDYNRYKSFYEEELEYEQSTYYTIRFRDELTNELLMQVTVNRRSSVTPPAPPTHEGYQFTGWSSDEYKSVTQSCTINALYTPVSSGGNDPAPEPKKYYSIIFKDGLSGKTISALLIEEGKDAVPPTPPVHEGYEFEKWSSNSYKNVTKVSTITAIYKKLSELIPKIDLAKVGWCETSADFPSNGSPFYGKKITVNDYITPYYIGRDSAARKLDPYVVTYKNNDRIGKATVYISPPSGIEYADNFTNKITLSFKIIPASPKYKSVVMNKTTAKISIAGVQGGCSYQYQIKKSGTEKWSGKKSSNKVLSFTKLKKDTKYTVRVRAYKTVSSTTYYSKWNNVTVKTTKKGSKTYSY